MNFILNTIPKKAVLGSMPAATDTVAYGKYLVSGASCGECHTKQVKGQVVSEPFVGGFEFPIPDGRVVVSANITPNKEPVVNHIITMQFQRCFEGVYFAASTMLKMLGTE